MFNNESKRIRDICLNIPLVSLHKVPERFVELRVYFIILGSTWHLLVV